MALRFGEADPLFGWNLRCFPEVATRATSIADGELMASQLY